jgi:hypothetical protein
LPASWPRQARGAAAYVALSFLWRARPLGPSEGGRSRRRLGQGLRVSKALLEANGFEVSASTGSALSFGPHQHEATAERVSWANSAEPLPLGCTAYGP